MVSRIAAPRVKNRVRQWFEAFRREEFERGLLNELCQATYIPSLHQPLHLPRNTQIYSVTETQLPGRRSRNTIHTDFPDPYCSALGPD